MRTVAIGERSCCYAGNPNVLPRAADLIQQQRLRTLDAIHVAVALSVAQIVAVDTLELVTRDNGQALAAAAVGLTVR